MPRKAPLPGDPNYRPAGGKGRGGAATGAPLREGFTAANQPPPDLKSAGMTAKAAMIAHLEAKRMAFADKLIALSEGAENETVQLQATIAALDRLDGKPTVAISGPDGGPQITKMVYEWADKPGG